MVFITGDVHGFEFDRFSYKNNPWLRDLTENDTIIVVGDWSIPWNDTTKKYDEHWLKWFDDKPWATLIVAGNHDNYWKYTSYPLMKYMNNIDTDYNAYCNPEYPKIRYITGPQYLWLDGYRLLAIPGADSQDISDGILDPTKPDYKQRRHDMRLHGHNRFRTLGVDWWPEEKIDAKRAESLARGIIRNDLPVDAIISHDVPSSYLTYDVDYQHFTPNDGELCLEKVRQMIQPKYFVCGHLHQEASVYDSRLDGWIIDMYNSIVPIDEVDDWAKEHQWNKED